MTWGYIKCYNVMQCHPLVSVDPRFDSVESFFLHFFFSPPFWSSSNSFSPFPLPSFLFSFSYSFPIHFLSSSSSCFLSHSASFLSLFPLYFILLISSSFSPPLSFSLFLFCLVFSFWPLNFFLVSPLYPKGAAMNTKAK